MMKLKKKDYKLIFKNKDYEFEVNEEYGRIKINGVEFDFSFFKMFTDPKQGVLYEVIPDASKVVTVQEIKKEDSVKNEKIISLKELITKMFRNQSKVLNRLSFKSNGYIHPPFQNGQYATIEIDFKGETDYRRPKTKEFDKFMKKLQQGFIWRRIKIIEHGAIKKNKKDMVSGTYNFQIFFLDTDSIPDLNEPEPAKNEEPKLEVEEVIDGVMIIQEPEKKQEVKDG